MTIKSTVAILVCSLFAYTGYFCALEGSGARIDAILVPKNGTIVQEKVGRMTTGSLIRQTSTEVPEEPEAFLEEETNSNADIAQPATIKKQKKQHKRGKKTTPSATLPRVENYLETDESEDETTKATTNTAPISNAPTPTPSDKKETKKSIKGHATFPEAQGNPDDAPFNEKWGLLPRTRLCHIDFPRAPKLGGRAVNLSPPSNNKKQHGMLQPTGLRFRFQCDGPRYHNYTETAMLPLIRRKQRDNPCYARRPTMVPPSPPKEHGQRHRTILVMGNSHTRQVVTAMVCHYRDQIVSSESFAPFSNEAMVVNTKITFQDSTLYVLANHPAVYSKTWKQTLELEILEHLSLNDLDAIVYGQFNQYADFWVASKLWRTMERYSRQYPSWNVDLVAAQKGIPLTELIEEYAGPIVRLSMFARFDEERYSVDTKAFASSDRHNLYGVDGRQHSREPEMAGGAYQYCPSNQDGKVSDCHHGPPFRSKKERRNYEDGHRCMGSKGGDPDLVAFELTEILWEIFS